MEQIEIITIYSQSYFVNFFYFVLSLFIEFKKLHFNIFRVVSKKDLGILPLNEIYFVAYL